MTRIKWLPFGAILLVALGFASVLLTGDSDYATRFMLAGVVFAVLSLNDK